MEHSGGDGYAAGVIYGDGVSGLSLPSDLESQVLDEAGRVWEWAAGGLGDACKKVGDAGGLGGGLNLVRQECLQGGVCGENPSIAIRPGHGADGIGDVHVVAVGDSLELPCLSLRKAVVLRRLSLSLDHFYAIDVLVNVDGRGRAADAFDDRGDDGNSGRSGAADGGGGGPGAGAREPTSCNPEP